MLDKDDGNIFSMAEVDQQVDIGNDAGTAVTTLLGCEEALLHIDNQQRHVGVSGHKWLQTRLCAMLAEAAVIRYHPHLKTN